MLPHTDTVYLLFSCTSLIFLYTHLYSNKIIFFSLSVFCCRDVAAGCCLESHFVTHNNHPV